MRKISACLIGLFLASTAYSQVNKCGDFLLSPEEITARRQQAVDDVIVSLERIPKKGAGDASTAEAIPGMGPLVDFSGATDLDMARGRVVKGIGELLESEVAPPQAQVEGGVGLAKGIPGMELPVVSSSRMKSWDQAVTEIFESMEIVVILEEEAVLKGAAVDHQRTIELLLDAAEAENSTSTEEGKPISTEAEAIPGMELLSSSQEQGPNYVGATMRSSAEFQELIEVFFEVMKSSPRTPEESSRLLEIKKGLQQRVVPSSDGGHQSVVEILLRDDAREGTFTPAAENLPSPRKKKNSLGRRGLRALKAFLLGE